MNDRNGRERFDEFYKELGSGVAAWATVDNALFDIFAMPTWIPLANVFSVGDALIGVGAAIAVVAAMHGRAPLNPRPAAPAKVDPAREPA